jgi:hypothetical protein
MVKSFAKARADMVRKTIIGIGREKTKKQERQHFSRKLKWGSSDFSSEKFAGG